MDYISRFVIVSLLFQAVKTQNSVNSTTLVIDSKAFFYFYSSDDNTSVDYSILIEPNSAELGGFQLGRRREAKKLREVASSTISFNHDYGNSISNRGESSMPDFRVKEIDKPVKSSIAPKASMVPFRRGQIAAIKIALLYRSNFNQSLEASSVQKILAKFSIDAFEAVVRLLPYQIPYEIVHFYGSDNNLQREVALKTFDAGIGDIMIRAEGYQLVEFSQPYLDVGIVMVVKTETDKSQAWFFLRLFTPWMWFILAAMSVFTGSVVWLIEQQNHTQNSNSLVKRIGTALSFSLSTLYYGQRESPNSCLAHIVLAPWFVLMLVVTSAFSTSLTSVITNSQNKPSATSIDMLKSTNAIVGCDGSSTVVRYLVKVLGFKRQNIRTIASIDGQAAALSGGSLKALFILKPYAKVWVAKYCREFAIQGQTYELGGFGFMFPKGSPLTSDMSQAILRLRESGELRWIEEEMFSSFNCPASESESKANQSLGPEPFVGFFVISGCASVIALLVIGIRQLKRTWDNTNFQSALMGRGFGQLLLTLFIQNQTRTELQLTR